MYKIYRLIIIVAFAFTSCNHHQSSYSVNKNNSSYDIKSDIEKLNDILKESEEPSQKFYTSSEKPITVNGKNGIVIRINPSDLTTVTGESIKDSIEIELRELVDQSSFFRSNIQTVSNKRLLVSGGAYFINITSKEKQLKIKEGKSLKIEIPRITDNEMSLFYGQRDSLGQMNWLKANETLKFRPIKKIQIALVDSISPNTTELGFVQEDTTLKMTNQEKEALEKVQKISKEIYYSVDIKSFGWVNCDRFLNTQTITDLYITFNPSDSVKTAVIFLIFKDINSIVENYFFPYNKKITKECFNSIPVGYRARLVALTVKNGITFSYAADITIEDKQTIYLKMNETKDEDIKKLLFNIDKKQ